MIQKKLEESHCTELENKYFYEHFISQSSAFTYLMCIQSGLCLKMVI